MPNWKKIALSGSSPEFSSLNVDNSISAGSLTGSLQSTNGVISSSAQVVASLNNQDVDFGTGNISASNIQVAEAIRHTGDSNTFISMSDDYMSFTAGNAKFIDYHEGYNGVSQDDRLIINPDKISALDFYLYGNNNNEAIIRTDAGTNKLWLKYHDDESGFSNNAIDRRPGEYYKGVNIRSNVLIDESKLYIKGTNETSDNDGGNIILQRIGDNNITNNEVLGGILFTGDDTDAPISGSTGFAIQARATEGWVSGSYPTKLVFYSGEKGHENWPDQGIFRIDPDGKTNIGTDDTPQEMLWVSGSIQSYVEGSFISASNLYGNTLTLTNSGSTEDTLLSVAGTVSASAYIGDGSGLTNVTSNITEEVTVSQTFTSATTASVNHLFGTKDVIVTVYDDNDDQFIPSRINTPDTNNVNIYMDPATTGRVVVAKGGHLVSGSIHKHLMTSVTSSTITHNLQEEFPVVQVYESASREMFLPETIKSIDQNNTQVVLEELIDCYVVIKR